MKDKLTEIIINYTVDKYGVTYRDFDIIPYTDEIDIKYLIAEHLELVKTFWGYARLCGTVKILHEEEWNEDNFNEGFDITEVTYHINIENIIFRVNFKVKGTSAYNVYGYVIHDWNITILSD